LELHTLGRYFTFTVQTSRDQPVITARPYRLIRHPSYAGLLMVIVAVGLFIGNWLSLLCLIVAVRALSCSASEWRSGHFCKTWVTATTTMRQRTNGTCPWLEAWRERAAWRQHWRQTSEKPKGRRHFEGAKPDTGPRFLAKPARASRSMTGRAVR
jgi:hypothetical protein